MSLRSQSGNALILIVFVVILVAGISLFVLERMGVTNLVNLPSSTSSTQDQAQTPLPTTSPITEDYQNPFDESSSTSSSYINPFETYENPFTNL